MRQPLPRQLISGTADASGNVSLVNQLQGPSGFFSLVYVAVQVSVGTPTWAVLAAAQSNATGAPLVYGSGNQVMLGPILLFPGERCTIAATGAGAGAIVLGQAMGWMAESAEELLGVTPLTTSLATPVSPLPITGSVSIIGSPPVSTVFGSKVSLFGYVSGQTLGDVSAPQLQADQASESITTTGGPILVNGASAVIASFKPATTIALRQSSSVVQGTNTQVQPLLAQSTNNGNLLVAWVTSGTQDSSTTAAGWVKAVSSLNLGSQWADIYYKPNCGLAEVMPIFTATPNGSAPMHAAIAEFTGALAAGPLDQTGSGGGGQFTVTATNTGVDAGFGDLVVLSTRFALTSPATATFAEVFNNGAVVTHVGDTGGSSVNRHSSFSFAIVPSPALTSQPLGVSIWAYDSVQTSAPAAGNAPSIVLAATGGKAWTLGMISAAAVATAATADRLYVQVLDGVTIIFNRLLAVDATIDRVSTFDLSDLGIKGTVGNSMTIKFASIAASTLGSLSVGAYLR